MRAYQITARDQATGGIVLAGVVTDGGYGGAVEAFFKVSGRDGLLLVESVTKIPERGER